MIINIITIFPEMFPGTLGFSLIGKAILEDKVKLNVIDLKKYGKGKHAQVDDTPYGGGAGMVLRADVLAEAIEELRAQYTETKIYYLSPRGKVFNQQLAMELSNERNVTFICGRFEGIDQRIIDFYQIQELSIGDFILCGGEVAVMVITEAIVRLLPEVLGNRESISEESFSSSGKLAGLLEYPLYTKPQNWNGVAVPEVLLSGHHKLIEEWRKAQAELTTQNRRPDLWNNYIKKNVSNYGANNE